MKEDRIICTEFANDESGRLMNVTTEILAITLFKDCNPNTTNQWTRISHEMRQHFRRMALGKEALS